jgi:hypothetical protein
MASGKREGPLNHLTIRKLKGGHLAALGFSGLPLAHEADWALSRVS